MVSGAELKRICGEFLLPDRMRGAEPFGQGHIHDTFVVRIESAGGVERVLLQRINRSVFPDPKAVMENVRRVTEHLRKKLPEAHPPGDPKRETLTLISTRAGHSCFCHSAGECWRMYRFIEGTETHQTAPSPNAVYEAARTFGRFQMLLMDLPGPRLQETIPDFHNTPKRYHALAHATRADVCERAKGAQAEIECAGRHAALASALVTLERAGKVRERIAHYDAKLNNVLFDKASERGLCVIDLDTVMPGLWLYDFGDMVRSMATRAEEDERDLSKVTVERDLFEALVRGYLASVGEVISRIERESFVLAAKVICFEQAIRFLADYLSGDTYYKVHRKEQNLDRCRTQLRLVESLEEQEEGLGGIIIASE